jgi:hypothetical protein
MIRIPAGSMTTHDYLEIAKNALDSKLLTFFILTTFAVNLMVLMQFLLGMQATL